MAINGSKKPVIEASKEKSGEIRGISETRGNGKYKMGPEDMVGI